MNSPIGTLAQFPKKRFSKLASPQPLAKRRNVRDNQNARKLKTVRDDAMQHSRVTSKGQTTIPGKIRKALRIKPGDKLEYLVEGDHATIRVHPGTRSLRGALASKKGKGMSFAQIREAAAEAARRDDVR